jgi:prepilin-type processing-associated H-X9-DG protein
MIDEVPPPNRAASEQPPAAAARQFSLRSVFGWTAWFAGLCGVAARAERTGDWIDATDAAALYLFVSLVIVAFRSSRWAMTAIGGCIFLFLLLMMIPHPARSKHAAYRAQCTNNLKQIAQALDRYHAVHGRYPPATVYDAQGRRMHSWRVLILPYLGEERLYSEYRMDEPWYGPHNRQLASRMPAVFRCPANPGHPELTSYVAPVGPGTAWDDPQGMRRDAIQDEAGDTVLVAEIADIDIHWMEPRDVVFRPAMASKEGGTPTVFSSKHAGAVVVAFVDGSVTTLSKEMPDTLLEALLTANGGEEVDKGEWW